MDTQATLDGYGRWIPNQCCGKTKNPYMKCSTSPRNMALLRATAPI